MTYIINTESILLFIGGKNIRVSKSDIRYPKIIKAFDKPLDEQESAILTILEPTKQSLESLKGNSKFVIKDDTITYNGDRLPNALVTKIKSILRDGLPIEHFEKFWENLDKNPNASSVKELMDFLEYKELPITEDGCFLAYKGLNDSYWSISGNVNTKVVTGQVDSTGRIFNGIGEEIEVRRRDVDDNRNNHCSFGLHVGSLKYASDFGSKVVVIKVNPADVVSVPTDYSCQKCRVSKYKVLSDFVGEVSATVVDSDGESTIVSVDNKERCTFTSKIENYLDRKRDEGYDIVTVRQIQSIFSPEWPSKQRVCDALQSICENWFEDEDGALVVEL